MNKIIFCAAHKPTSNNLLEAQETGLNFSLKMNCPSKKEIKNSDQFCTTLASKKCTHTLPGKMQCAKLENQASLICAFSNNRHFSHSISGN